MHHALHIHEILLEIFVHCNSPRFNDNRHERPFGVVVDLVALARTCRTFKEPALDVLWSELSDLCPLARCLPNVSYQLIPGFKCYSFKRSLEDVEWDTLRSYTRRIRSVLDFGSALHPNCVRTFLRPPTLEPLFPNLRYLRCVFTNEITPLLHQPLPSLISLDYSFIFKGSLPLLQKSLEPFPDRSPNMKKLSIRVHEPQVMFDTLVSNYVRRWSDPQCVHCPQIAFDVHALAHLSRVSGLDQLSFALTADAIPVSDTLLFSTLRELKLVSGSLDLVARLLANVQFHTLEDFAIEIGGYPSKESVISFLNALQPSGMGDSITRLRLTQVHHSFTTAQSNPLVLTADDLRPTMALKNLRSIDLNLGWMVDLTDKNLLELASAWPYLEHLHINEEWGWKTTSGITPNGLVHLLQLCRSLCRLSVVIDTRGYMDVPPLKSPPCLGLAIPPSLSLNVIDSVIDVTSVPAMAAFLANLTSAPCSLRAWSSWAFTWRTEKRVYADRWREVYARARDAVA